MSHEPEAKKRKMEPHIGGDNCQIQQQISKSLHNLPSGSASGDFGGDDLHQYVTAISGDDGIPENPENYKIFRQGCELGDEWEQKYPTPLSNYPRRTIRTGNTHYDIFISSLETHGFKPLQIVAKGRSGSILLAQDLQKVNHYKENEYIPVAVKLNTGKSRRKSRVTWKTDMSEEMNLLKQLEHPSIISWICNINYDGRVGIVMEFCENGNLEQLLRLQEARFLTEPVCRKYFKMIFDGIEYLHFQNIAHRDICTQNILVTYKNTLKLSDFGHAVYYITGDPLRKDECGSIGFQAPEIVAKTAYNPKLSDIWSVGCTLYLMATGRYPLGLIQREILVKASKELQFPEERVLPLSQALRNILRGTLAFLPEMRFTLNRIKHGEWMKIQNNRVQIGNFHMIRQPKKIREGEIERQLKTKYEI